MANSPILLHEHDEYLDSHVFLEGITVYESLIMALASKTDPEPQMQEKTQE